MNERVSDAAVGSFTFVLHSHLPYCRRAGRWPHGEEWIHEAASETYLPLIDALRAIQRDQVPINLTLGMTPILVEQLADRDVLRNLVIFMTERRDNAESDIARFRGSDEPEREPVARWYRDRFNRMLALLQDELRGDIIGAIRDLQDAGVIEVATSAATHAYLPLISRDSTINAQVGTGVRSYVRHFGRRPRSFWLPECAYRPAYQRNEDGQIVTRPGLEAFLADEGLRVFFVETHTIEGGRPVGKAAGEATGPYEEITRRWVVPMPPASVPTHQTTFYPYWVTQPQVAALGRNNRTGMQVWSAEHGYPGDQGYREFHKRDGISGLHYWSVTGPRVDLGDKAIWHPAQAFARTAVHAAHFAGLVRDQIVEFHQHNHTHGVISAAFDTELFGHWWFEGVDWLAAVLRQLSAVPEVDLTSAGTYVTQHPPETVLNLPESSWGEGGGHFVWDNAATRWMWPIIHQAEARMESMAERFAQSTGVARRAVNQAAREALLLQSSDWPFLITTGQAKEYAAERFENHIERFNELCDLAESGRIGPEGEAVIRRCEELDNPFPDIDLSLFRAKHRAVAS